MANIEDLDTRRFEKEFAAIIVDKEMRILICKMYLQGFDSGMKGNDAEMHKIAKLLRYLEGG